MKDVKKQLIQIKKVNSDDLIYRYKGNIADLKFDQFDNALNIINKIQNGEISLADVKNNQEKFKSYLGEIKKGNKKHRSKEQENTLFNIEILYKARNEVIKFYDDYSVMMSEAKTKATKGTGLNPIWIGLLRDSSGRGQERSADSAPFNISGYTCLLPIKLGRYKKQAKIKSLT